MALSDGLGSGLRGWRCASACDSLAAPWALAARISRHRRPYPRLAGPSVYAFARQAGPGASLEVPLPSALAGHAALSGAGCCRDQCGRTLASIRTIPLQRLGPSQPAGRSLRHVSHRTVRSCGLSLRNAAQVAMDSGRVIAARRRSALLLAARVGPSFDRLRGLVGISSRRHSWDSALRSLAPARRLGRCFHRQSPTCRLSGRPPRSFLLLGGSAVDADSPPYLYGTANRRRPDPASGFLPACNPYPVDRSSGADTALGFWPLSGLRAPSDGCGRTHLDPVRSISLWRPIVMVPIRSWACGRGGNGTYARQVTANAELIHPPHALQRVEGLMPG